MISEGLFREYMGAYLHSDIANDDKELMCKARSRQYESEGEREVGLIQIQSNSAQPLYPGGADPNSDEMGERKKESMPFGPWIPNARTALPLAEKKARKIK